MSVSFTRKESPRRLRRLARKKKMIGVTVALLATASITTFVGVEAMGRIPIKIAAITAEQSNETATEQGTETIVEETVQEEKTPVVAENAFRESVRTGKDRIWLNPDQAKEGHEAPLFIALCFHEVTDDRPDDKLAVSKGNFRKIIKELKNQGYWFLDSNDIIAIKKGEMEQPAKGVFISFDDGYEDNYTNAFPIIRAEGVKATFFLPSSLISKPNRMNVNQLKEMAAYGMCFGSHTVNHQELDKLSDDQIKKEMNDSKYVLQHDYGIKIESLAYPGGFQSELTLQEAAKNYEIAFTASMDENTPDTIYTIHRYGVFRWNDSLASIIKN